MKRKNLLANDNASNLLSYGNSRFNAIANSSMNEVTISYAKNMGRSDYGKWI